MRWQSTIVVPLLCLGTFVWAQNDQTSSANQNERNTAGSSELQKATEVVEHMSATAPDKGVPKQVLEGAKCVAVIPKLVKGAFVVGGEHGTGAATCRISGNSWSAPAPFSVSGISWGPQIGGKSSDLLMFIGCRRSCGTAGFCRGGVESWNPHIFRQQGRIYWCFA